MAALSLDPIGWVRSTRTSPTDDDWDSETTTVVLADHFGAEALFGQDQFAHLDIVYGSHPGAPN